MITTAVAASTDGRVVLGPGPTYGILLVTLFLHGIVCSAGTRIIARLNLVFALIISTTQPFFTWLGGLISDVTVGGAVSAIIVLPVCAGENRVSASVAFGSYSNFTGWSNCKPLFALTSRLVISYDTSAGWAFLLAFIAPMWQFTGCECQHSTICQMPLTLAPDDSAAHISEETSGAATAAPTAILLSVASVGCIGWIQNIAVSFSISSVPDLLSSPLALPMGQLYLDVIGKKGMLAIWSVTIAIQVSVAVPRVPRVLIVARNQFLCGAAQGVDASRVVFAFARDNALPGSRWWKTMNSHTQTPVNAAWLVMFLSAICGLLGFSSAALTSLARYVSFADYHLELTLCARTQCFRYWAIHVVYHPHIPPNYVRAEQTRTWAVLPWPLVDADWHNSSSLGDIHYRTSLFPDDAEPGSIRHEYGLIVFYASGAPS